MDDLTRRRLTRNEELFRQINEEIDGNRAGTGTIAYVCECADPGCADTLRLTAAEYAAVRAGEGQFVVAPGHVVPELEEIVAAAADHVVVEKDV